MLAIISVMIKTYRFDYYISEPIVSGGFKGRRGTKQITGYDVRGAALNLYKALGRKWALPIKLEIDGGLILEETGICGINPDLLPEINASLFVAHQIACRSEAA